MQRQLSHVCEPSQTLKGAGRSGSARSNFLDEHLRSCYTSRAFTKVVFIRAPNRDCSRVGFPIARLSSLSPAGYSVLISLLTAFFCGRVWKRWAEDEGDFHMHLVETDHMSIKNHPLMLRLLFRDHMLASLKHPQQVLSIAIRDACGQQELAGHCGMSEECEQEFKRCGAQT
eukprot:3028014-Amphidinium_carterae.1